MEIEGDSAYCYNAILEYRQTLEDYKNAVSKIEDYKIKKNQLLETLENTRTITPELHAKGYVEVNGELRNCNVPMKCATSINLYENGQCDPASGKLCFKCDDVESPYSGDDYQKKCKCQHNIGCCTMGDCKNFNSNGQLSQSIFAQEINPQIEALDTAIMSEKLKIRDMQLLPDCNPPIGVSPPTDPNSPTFYEDGIKFCNEVAKVLPDIPKNTIGLSPADIADKKIQIDKTFYGIRIELWIIMFFVIISLIYLYIYETNDTTYSWL
jgi:hypothetical protein